MKKRIKASITVVAIVCIIGVIHYLFFGNKSITGKDKEDYLNQGPTINQTSNGSESLETLEEPIDFLEDTMERETSANGSSTEEATNKKQTGINKDTVAHSNNNSGKSLTNNVSSDNSFDANIQPKPSDKNAEEADTSDSSSQQKEKLSQDKKKKDLAKVLEEQGQLEEDTTENAYSDDESTQRKEEGSSNKDLFSHNEDIGVDLIETDESDNSNQEELSQSKYTQSDPHNIRNGDIPRMDDDIELPIVEVD